MPVIINVATVDELETLVNLGEALHESEMAYEPLLTFSYQKAKEKYLKEFKNKDALFLIAKESNKIIGYLYAHADKIDYLATNKKECEIEAIFISEQHRGRKIAKLLIDQCISWAKTNNTFRIKCGIYAHNSSSNAAFQNYGFVPYHTTYTLPLIPNS